MTRDYEEPTVDQYGRERHPAWGTILAHRQQSTGTHLFDSDIIHQNTVAITLYEASRKRDLHHDHVMGDKVIAEVVLSEAQWASFVSTLNSGSGVPCTIGWTRDGTTGRDTPDFPHQPRLAETMAETHRAAQAAFDEIQAAFDALEAAMAPTSNAPMKEKREALRDLKYKIQNATPNVDFAGKVLIEHAEDVVQKAKADVEAFVIAKAHQLGLDPAAMTVELPGPAPLAIEAAPEGNEHG